MSNETKISVIVPVYNCEMTLSRCIESLLCQTHADIEIILVNDESGDRSLSIIEDYAVRDQRIVAINNAHGGVSHTRNTGILHATGKYIMFCDSDDYVEPTWCEVLFRQMTEQGVAMGICGVRVVKPKDVRLRNVGETQFFEMPEFFALDSCDRFSYTVWDKIFLKDYIVELFDQSFEFGEDVLFVLQYLKQFCIEDKIAIGSVAVYNYDLGVGTNRLSNKWYDTHHKFAQERERLAVILAEKWKVSQKALQHYVEGKRNSLLISDIYLLASPKNKRSFATKYRAIKKLLIENKAQIDAIPITSRLICVIKLRSPLVILLACKLFNR